MKTKLAVLNLVLVEIVAVSFTPRPSSANNAKEQKQQTKSSNYSPVGGLELEDKLK